MNKGTDQAIFSINSRNGEPVNEIDNYQRGRYVSTNEALWRFYSFKLHDRYPPVVRLSVHLENGQQVYFNRQNLKDKIAHPANTTLMAFFKLCKEDNFAKNLLYVDVPKYYKWDASKQWIRRKQGERVEDWPNVRKTNVIGRVYTVHVANFECFCLRMLLFNIRGPTNFADLKNFNGREFESYSAACRGLGRLENDDQWNDTRLDGALTNSPAKLRNLFAILLGYCGVSEPVQLWNNFKDSMSENYLFDIR